MGDIKRLYINDHELFESYNGDSLTKGDVYMNGGKLVAKNTGIFDGTVINGALLELEYCVVISSDGHQIRTSNSVSTFPGSVHGSEIVGEGGFFPHYVSTAINAVSNRAFGFYSKPKTVKAGHSYQTSCTVMTMVLIALFREASEAESQCQK